MLARRRSLLAVVALASCIVAGAGAPTRAQTGGEQAGVGIRLVEVPADKQDDPRAQSYIVDHVSPGDRFTRRIDAVNGTDKSLTLRLYAVGADVKNGLFVPADGQNRELANWVTVAPSSVTVPPGRSAPATVTIAVPRDASPGERYGAVFVERPPDEAQIGVASRAGIRIYLSVGGSEPTTDFELETFEPKLALDGSRTVDIRACNTGGRAIDLTGAVELSDGPGEIEAGPFETAGGTTVAPSTCATVPIKLSPELPRGPWRAKVTLRSGQRERSAEATITFPEAGQSTRPVKARELEQGRGRWAVLIAILLLLLLLLAIGTYLGRRRGHKPHPSD